MIIFENIETGETVGISQESEGKFYRAKLSALMNSSNMSPNSDRGQDFGWRLAPEQQALIENWEQDPQMIDRVSVWSKVMIDALTHSEFLAYMLYQQELGTSPQKADAMVRREQQREYEARVNALRVGTVEAMQPFDAAKRGEATLEDFLNGDLDDSGQSKPEVVEEPLSDEAKAELDAVIAEVNATTEEPVVAEPPVVEPTVVGAEKQPEAEAPKPKTPKTKK